MTFAYNKDWIVIGISGCHFMNDLEPNNNFQKEKETIVDFDK